MFLSLLFVQASTGAMNEFIGIANIGLYGLQVLSTEYWVQYKYAIPLLVHTGLGNTPTVNHKHTVQSLPVHVQYNYPTTAGTVQVQTYRSTVRVPVLSTSTAYY